MKSYSFTTLNEFIVARQKEFPYAKGELSSLLHHMSIAAPFYTGSRMMVEKAEEFLK